jgi:RNA polymerase sigma-70 factor, ECF subfamily
LKADAADERLLVEAAQKDPRRFAALYELHFTGVYAFVVSRVRNRNDAEDVTSEVFRHALANLPKFEWREVPFKAWLMRIATNVLNDRWHVLARERGNPVAGEPSVSSEHIEHRAALFELVERLPPDQQRVIIMRFVEQKRLRDIARELGRSEGAVKQLQFRAMETLRAQMGDRHA